jgi:phosphatidylinositol alpha-1,6-mannosyltransferase
MVALRPGVAPADFAPDSRAAAGARAQFGLGDGPLVLCLSRLVPRKGQDVLIRAWPQVAAAHPEARLVIAGSGKYGRKLRALAKASPAGAAITFTGRVDVADMPGLYAAAAVFAMPCRSRRFGMEVEGLGIVYLEAQAAGVPAVVGRSGGAPESVAEGETGYVVDGRAPGDVASRLVELLDDPTRAAAMGAAGRRRVERDWDWRTRYETLRALLSPDAPASPPE